MRPIPFRPDYSAARAATVTSVVRALVAAARARFESDNTAAVRIIKNAWPRDHLAMALITRATAAPAMTTVAGWAQELGHTIVLDVLASLGPAAIGGELLELGTVLEWGGSAKINVPGVVASSANASFVGQGSPIPARQLSVSAVSLTPAKFATIFSLTEEQISSSNAEQLMHTTLIDSLAADLDTALFDSNAADSTRPAGLLYNITPITATTGGGDVARLQDLGKLVNAVSPTGGIKYALVGDPGTAEKLKDRVGPKFDTPIFGSNGVAANSLVCVAVNALVSVLEAAPRVDTRRGVATHLNTVPAEIVTSGGVMATPIKSAFQTDSVAIRFIADVAWALRAPGAIAWIQNITW
jgi:hypothetical protein